MGVVEHFVQFHDHHVVRSKLDCDRCVIVHLQLVHSTVHSNTNCPTRGSAAWLWTCILPAGSLNMWGHVLSQLELTKDGITAKTWSKSVVENADVSASSIFAITIFNCFFYGFLTFYFDNVLPKEFGQIGSRLGFCSRKIIGFPRRKCTC